MPPPFQTGHCPGTVKFLDNCLTFTFHGTPPCCGYPRHAYCATTMLLNSKHWCSPKMLTINSFPRQDFPWSISRHIPDISQIPGHFQLFQTSDHPDIYINLHLQFNYVNHTTAKWLIAGTLSVKACSSGLVVYQCSRHWKVSSSGQLLNIIDYYYTTDDLKKNRSDLVLRPNRLPERQLPDKTGVQIKFGLRPKLRPN